MTDYTAKKVILQDSDGNYLIPYTDKQDKLTAGDNITIDSNVISTSAISFPYTASYTGSTGSITTYLDAASDYFLAQHNDSETTADVTSKTQIQINSNEASLYHGNTTNETNVGAEIKVVSATDTDTAALTDSYSYVSGDSVVHLSSRLPLMKIYNDGTTTSEYPVLDTYSITLEEIDSLTTTAKTIPAAINGLQTTANLKANITLNNLNATGTTACAHYAMPSDKYTSLTLGTTGTTYTAPADGYYYLSVKSTTTTAYNAAMWFTMISTNSSGYVLVGTNHMWNGASGSTVGFIPVKKGDTVKITYNRVASTNEFRFCYAQGTQS